MEQAAPIGAWRRRWIVLFTLLSLGLLVGGFSYYRFEKQRIRDAKYQELAAIAELKAGRIGEWRQRHRAFALRVTTSPLFEKAVAQWLRDPATPGLTDDLRERLRLDLMDGVYADALLLDLDGRALLSVMPEPMPLEPTDEQAWREAVATRSATVSDLYRCSCGSIHMDAAAPVLGPQDEPIAVVILRCNADREFYPLVQSWPTPSRSAETLLVEESDGQVLYLNELRHQQGTALSLRLPFSRTDLPAVQAVLGKRGLFEGRDYRGRAVLADMRPIPESPWFIVTKVDESEILSEVHYRAGVSALFVLGLLLLSAMAAAYIDRQRRLAVLGRMYSAEREQRELQQEFRTTLYSIGDAVITTDTQERVKQMNREGERLTGWPEAEAVGRPLGEIFHIINEETRAIVESPVERVLREGKVVGLANHTLLVARDGREHPIADSGAPIRNEGDEISGVVLIFRDQAVERASERALRESETRFEAVFRASPVGIAITRLDEGRFVDASASFLRMFGFTREEVIGRTSRELGMWVQPAARERMMGLLRDRGRMDEVEFEFHTKAGAPGRVLVWGEVIQLEGEQYLLSVHLDVTERLRSERALKAARENLGTALRASNAGLWDWDMPTGELDWSEEFYTLFGLPSDAPATFETWIAALHPEDRDIAQQRLAKALEDRTPLRQEYRICLPDGTVRWIGATGDTFCDAAGAQVRMSGICIDVTEAKQAEAEREQLEAQLRQAQKMESIGRLAGSVAHDFNNMLFVILGRCELALAGLERTSPAHADVQEIQSAAQRSADLTRQLLAFSRRQAVLPQVIDINARVTQTEQLLRRIIGEDIELRIGLGAGLWPVRVDPSQMDQLVTNLAINGREAMPEGGTLSVSTACATVDEAYCQGRPEARPGDFVVLTVGDTGCGMDQKTLEHAFEPFYTTKRTGTGLGLATVYGIVAQNEGFIDISSAPGRGTIVRVHLPRYLGAEAPEPETRQEEAAVGGDETILLVEDQDDSRRVARAMLERLGYRVLEAAGPLAALDLSRAHAGKIDLLLTDVVMPVMNGMELSRQVAAGRPGIEILFMSGYAAGTIAPTGVLAPGIRFLAKPFATEALSRKLREVLGARVDAP